MTAVDEPLPPPVGPGPSVEPAARAAVDGARALLDDWDELSPTARRAVVDGLPVPDPDPHRPPSRPGGPQT